MTDSFEEWLKAALDRELEPARRVENRPGLARYALRGNGRALRLPWYARAGAALAPLATMKVAAAAAATSAVLVGSGAAVRIAAQSHLINPSGVPVIGPALSAPDQNAGSKPGAAPGSPTEGKHGGQPRRSTSNPGHPNPSKGGHPQPGHPSPCPSPLKTHPQESSPAEDQHGQRPELCI